MLSHYRLSLKDQICPNVIEDSAQSHCSTNLMSLLNIRTCCLCYFCHLSQRWHARGEESGWDGEYGCIILLLL